MPEPLLEFVVNVTPAKTDGKKCHKISLRTGDVQPKIATKIRKFMFNFEESKNSVDLKAKDPEFFLGKKSGKNFRIVKK